MLLISLFVLLVFQLAGESFSRGLHLPVPGPVLGMLMLSVFYVARRREPNESMKLLSEGLLGWLGLLFVPAGVGIITQLPLLRSAWLPLSVALVGSTVFTLLLTASIMHWFARRQS